MHCARQQLHFEFLGEEALAADFRQRLVEDFVALGGDDFFLAFQIRVKVFQSVYHPLGLPAGESGGTGCKNKFHG